MSRDWVLKTAPNGVHYSIGGKLTSARQDAAQIVDQVCMQLGIQKSCATQDRFFPWAPQHSKEFEGLQENFSTWAAAMQARATQLGVDPESALWLIRRHGCNVAEILHTIELQPALADRIIPELPFIEADLMYCAANEMVVHLDDLLRRRIPLLILSKLTEAALHRIAGKISGIMNWDETRYQQEIKRCQTAFYS